MGLLVIGQTGGLVASHVMKVGNWGNDIAIALSQEMEAKDAKDSMYNKGRAIRIHVFVSNRFPTITMHLNTHLWFINFKDLLQFILNSTIYRQ